MASRAAHFAGAYRIGEAGGLVILCDLLHIERGLTAVIGGGGKTTLLRCLAQECMDFGTVIVATSTKMMVPDWCSVLIDPSFEDVQAALESEGFVCVGSIHKPSGKLDAPGLPFDGLAAIADYVLVEADGAKTLPCKAHAAHEPVIPECANQTISVVGIDCVGKRIEDTCHRPELFAQLAEASVDDVVTPSMVARVMNAEALGQRVLINKVESDEDWLAAKDLASLLNCPVAAGSLKEGTVQCLS